MAHGRCPVSACDLVRNQATSCSIDALNAPRRSCLTPTIGTRPCLQDLCCTVGTTQIPIAPAHRGAHSPAASFPGGFRTPARRPRACCELSDGAGIRNPSHKPTNAAQQQLRPTLKRIDAYVIRWARRKFKRMRHQTKGARDWFDRFRRANRPLFAHWVLCHGNG
jgi:hypothetical protein